MPRTVPQESAYAHLGNVLQMLYNLKVDLPDDTVTLTVAVEEIEGMIARIEAARHIIHRYSLQVTGGVHL